MADTPDLGSGASRRGGSSPPSRILLALLCASALFTSCSNSAFVANLEDPADSLEWLGDPYDTRRQLYLSRESRRSQKFFERHSNLITALFNEIIGEDHLTAGSESAAVRVGDYLYFRRQELGQRQPVYLRKLLSGSHEEVLLDLNQFPHAHGLSMLRVSPNQRLVALAVETETGSNSSLLIYDSSRRGLKKLDLDHIYNLEWLADNTSALVTLEENLRPNRLVYLPLESSSTPRELYRIADNSGRLSLKRAADGQTLFLLEESSTQTSAFLISSQSSCCELKVVAAPPGTTNFNLETHQGWLLVQTSQAVFRLSPELASMHRIISTDVTENISEIESFGSSLGLFLKRDGQAMVQIHDLALGKVQEFKPQLQAYSIEKTPRARFEGEPFRFKISSFLLPDIVMEYDQQSNGFKVVSELTAPIQPDASVKRTFATARDGTHIPVSLVLPKNHSGAVLLKAYGAYGKDFDVKFDASTPILLSRGLGVAIAHVRGGGEYGPGWHAAGRSLNKMTSVTDLIDCAHFMIDTGIARRNLMFGMGRSAGGMLFARAAQLQPDLFEALILEMPFLDVLGTLRDPSWPATTIEYGEWGDPSDARHLQAIRQYSPYENIRTQQDFPATLIVVAERDLAIPSWQTMRWAAKQSLLNPGSEIITLVSESASHEGESNIFESAMLKAKEIAFILAKIEELGAAE